MDQVILLLKGALAANNMVGLKMNVEEKNLKKILNLLTSLKNPTLAPLAKEGWVAVETVIDEKLGRDADHLPRGRCAECEISRWPRLGQQFANSF